MTDTLGGSRWFPSVPGTGAERFPRTPTVPSGEPGGVGTDCRASGTSASAREPGTGGVLSSESLGVRIESLLNRSPSRAPQRAVAARLGGEGAPVVLSVLSGRWRGKREAARAIAFWRAEVQS